ncbi:MAG: L,D-transpeptidase family protein [Candidatus Liptonbacteria bacterium]|nr:L,D-transpeptidase family protein [Candidatus Liptonbacteria bacterium]
MDRKKLSGAVPVLILSLALAVGAAVFFALSAQHREVVYRYDVSLPRSSAGTVPFEYGSWPAMAQADFFRNVRNQFIQSQTDFVEADLSEMVLRVYRAGNVALQVPIRTKGREGSWWETPAGLYRIESKEPDHFSTFGQVHQPWSMAFQGNFFIHGWPTHEDGSPVSSTYSGGCIRLLTPDAEQVYKLVRLQEPVLVYAKQFESDGFTYRQSAPEVSAGNYLVADLQSNFVLYEKDSTIAVPIASLTKLMTALIAAEYINLDRDITVSQSAIVFTSKPRLRAGQSILAFQLLYPLLMESSNEAAFALADRLGRERFVALMNTKAQALGMTDTRFVDPAGSGEGNVASAQDLFTLAKYLRNNRSFVLKLTTGRLRDSAYGPPIFTDLKNFNVFDADPDFIGGKVGQTTAARETILSLFDLDIQGQRRPVVIIVLGSEDRAKDATTLLQAIRTSYQ